MFERLCRPRIPREVVSEKKKREADRKYLGQSRNGNENEKKGKWKMEKGKEKGCKKCQQLYITTSLKLNTVCTAHIISMTVSVSYMALLYGITVEIHGWHV